MFTSPNRQTRSDCALCHQVAKLRHSHIVPEFFYRRIYDMPEHKFHVISTDKAVADDFGMKGYREHLLCEACEGRTGAWDDYASKFFFGDAAQLIARGQKSLHLANVSYKPFKLFLMSLLWRMHIAEGELFEQVDLGEKHGECLRLALLSDNPLGQEDYPCLVVAVLIDGRFLQDWILQPEVVRIDARRWYRLVVCGYLFAFAVASHPLPRDVSKNALAPTGELVISVEDIRQIQFLSGAFSRFQNRLQIPTS